MTASAVMVWVGTRADLFPLGPVLEGLARAEGIRPCAVVNDVAAPLLDEVDLAGVDVHRLTSSLNAESRQAEALSGPAVAAEVTDLICRLSPAAMVVLGDRWELLYVVPPAVILGVPVVHLHGGEVTGGAIDDRVRHAISKLADLHCVSTAGAARRLRQLGEMPDRVVVTGAPSLDRLTSVTPASDDELATILHGELRRPLALATYHPATAADEDPAATTDAILEALSASTGTAVLTHPGLDAGRSVVLERLTAAAQANSALRLVASLGADYPRVMAAADVVVGNSSSGILEAASFGIPVVDVGARQTGRERGINVITVEAEEASIAAGIRRALGSDFRATARTAGNPYGDGHAADRIVAAVRRAVAGVPLGKPFVDMCREIA